MALGRFITLAMNSGELRIHYRSPCGIDMKLDVDLQKILEKHGYKWTTSGYDLVTCIRDIGFDKVKIQVASGGEAPPVIFEKEK